MKIIFRHLIGLTFLISLYSCSSEQAEITLSTDALTAEISTDWLGVWERNDWQNEAGLEIKSIKNNSIEFSMVALNGGNTGDVDGFATVNKNSAVYLFYEQGDTCRIVFTRIGDSVIIIDHQKGICFAAMGVQYSGRYKNSKLLPKTQPAKTLLELNIFDSAQQDSTFKALVGNSYDLFVNATQLISEPEDLDSLHCSVKACGVRGLYTYMENIIMIDSTNTIWAAVINDNKVFYYTNSKAYKKVLPKTIDMWREHFKRYEVIYK